MVPIQPVCRPALPRRHLTLGHLALGALALGALPAIASAAPAQAPSANEAFHRAYYLEHEKGDLAAAMKLYRKAVKSGSLSSAERMEIEEHMRACAEELAMADLAQLVPGNTIVYAELNDPGAQLESLMDQLGLLQGTDRAGQIAVSPHLLRGVLGLKGAAVAVTRIDPTAGMPGGVLILHPGDMEAVRGLIETVLPAGGQSVEPIAGHPTFLVENMVHVTMGERLVIASTERHLIEDVLRRVDGDPLAFAGLWEQWKGSESEAPRTTFTILTTDASDDLAGLHDRMPCIIERDDFDRWLTPEIEDEEATKRLLGSAPKGTLITDRVSTRVNNVRNEGPDLLTPDTLF